jgi:hypothetical protein
MPIIILKIVAIWSKGKFFTQAMGEIKLNSGESILYQESIKLNHLKPATYQLYGLIKSRNEISSQPLNIVIK